MFSNRDAGSEREPDAETEDSGIEILADLLVVGVGDKGLFSDEVGYAYYRDSGQGNILFIHDRSVDVGGFNLMER